MGQKPISCPRRKERGPVAKKKAFAAHFTFKCLVPTSCISSSMWNPGLEIPANWGVVNKISALITNFLLSPLLLWNSRHFILFLHSLVSEIPFYVSGKNNDEKENNSLMKIHESRQSLEAVLFIQESIMTFKNTGILCLCGFFALVLFLCVLCLFSYLCSCWAYVLGLKVENHLEFRLKNELPISTIIC